VVDVETLELIGMEALLRWQNPAVGLVLPEQFVDLAEETGLIVPIGEWALRTACVQNRRWQRAGLPPRRVAVNLSTRQFQIQLLPDLVRRALGEADLEPRYLALELTESMLMHADEVNLRTLHEFRRMELKISVDDFGTGYSSLSYLKHLPVDHLKIDRSFIRGVTEDSNDAAITKAVIAMAHGLNLKVVAEGVETEEQLAFLREHACDEAQGFLFGEPVPADAFEKLWRERFLRSEPG
jgi:EAL domain-containing protein (putative c-di-GMP-specific phosphodiesterase class I)